MSATKFLCVKASNGEVVATSFPYLTVPIVHRWIMIAGDVPIYLKFMFKVTHPFRKCRFRQMWFNSSSAVRAGKKVQLSLIGSPHCAFSSSHTCALPLSPPNGGSKWEFLYFACFSYLCCNWQLVIDTSVGLICMWVKHSKSQLSITNRRWHGHGRVTWSVLNF